MERKEGNVFFNDALQTFLFTVIWKGKKEMFYLTMHSTHFYVRLYGIGCMVKDYLDSKRGNLLPSLAGLLFLISSRN